MVETDLKQNELTRSLSDINAGKLRDETVLLTPEVTPVSIANMLPAVQIDLSSEQQSGSKLQNQLSAGSS